MKSLDKTTIFHYSWVWPVTVLCCNLPCFSSGNLDAIILLAPSAKPRKPGLQHQGILLSLMAVRFEGIKFCVGEWVLGQNFKDVLQELWEIRCPTEVDTALWG